MIYDFNWFLFYMLPKDWKDANISLVHKNADKRLMTNYYLVSLLPTYGRIFEKVPFTSLYKH